MGGGSLLSAQVREVVYDVIKAVMREYVCSQSWSSFVQSMSKYQPLPLKNKVIVHPPFVITPTPCPVCFLFYLNGIFSFFRSLGRYSNFTNQEATLTASIILCPLPSPEPNYPFEGNSEFKFPDFFTFSLKKWGK